KVEVEVMDRDEALKLLKGGPEGIAEWNRRRLADEEIPILVGADLRGADLVEADLHGANLHGANLVGADLRDAYLHEADLGWAKCSGTIFANVDLSQIKGLDHVFHSGQSTIGIDTILRSQGRIPETFLRGCGVPDPVIAFLPALIGSMQPIQFYSCF